MSSLTLITGSIDGIEDPLNRLDISELYYEFWEEDDDDDTIIRIRRDFVPIRQYGISYYRIIQYLGSGKTLAAMHLISQAAYEGGDVAANLGLIWDNEGIPKTNWTSKITTLDDLKNLEDSTVLIDDIKSTITRWDCQEAEVVSQIANAGRKLNLDLISTAQREMMFPKDIREMATQWIVPIIRVRDMTQWTPDHTGKPIEMILLYFDGSKTFIRQSPPIIGLDRLFESYSTIQRAIPLKKIELKKKNKNIFERN